MPASQFETFIEEPKMSLVLLNFILILISSFLNEAVHVTIRRKELHS